MSAHLFDSVDDDYNAHVDLRRNCRNCGRKAPLEDGWCPRCNGETPGDVALQELAEAREATRRAEERALRGMR